MIPLLLMKLIFLIKINLLSIYKMPFKYKLIKFLKFESIEKKISMQKIIRYNVSWINRKVVNIRFSSYLIQVIY